MAKTDFEEILKYIDPANLDYTEWLQVGMALKAEGYEADLFEDWSASDPRHITGECYKKWDSFNDSGVTGAFIVMKAKENGWQPGRKLPTMTVGKNKYNVTFSWEDDSIIKDQGWLETEEFQEPKNWNPVNDAVRYLETLFDPSEIVGYVMKSRFLEDRSKYIPANKGAYTVTAGQLIDALKADNAIEKAFGSYDRQAGAWIRFNPLNGGGVKNENVSDYRYALVECDNMELDRQIAMMKELRLPIAAMVYSGGKSVHAIVKIEAATYAEYKSKVDFLYKICADNGLTLDTQNKNPSRLSRMPGVYRGKHKQFLLDTDIGLDSYEAWKDWIDETTDNLPDPESLTDIMANPMPLAPELIAGCLRVGHKMLISGPSKAGKSYLLIELAFAIAEGMNWLGMRCRQGKVMYVNLEIDRASCQHRFQEVYKAMGFTAGTHYENITVWSLRGYSTPLDDLVPKLIRRCREQNYVAVIIDPIYKVITGDENNASDMGKFCNEFDKIATELQCSVIYCHHHSKGYQGQKRAVDRASGSGVFARDPDAVMDLVQLDLEQAVNEVHTGWRIECTLREFKNVEPIDAWFDFPIHKVTDELKDSYPQSDFIEQQKQRAIADERRKERRKERQEQEYDEKVLKLATAYDKLLAEKGEVISTDMLGELGITKNTLKDWLNKIGGYRSIQRPGKSNIIVREDDF